STRSMAATGTSQPAVSPTGSCGDGGFAVSEATDYRDDYPEHDGLVAVDDVVSGVARFELDVAVAAPEHLHGGLAVDHGGDDLAGVGFLLLADHDEVTVADRGVDHQIGRASCREGREDWWA